MESLRGNLLVAGGGLFDPNFRRAVVLVGEHTDQGALGVVINRPSPLLVADAAPPLAPMAGDEARVFFGGPVQPEAAVVVAEFDHPELSSLQVFGSVGFLVSGVEEAAPAIRRARVFAGYAGWGPGQLEKELEEDAWIVEAARTEDVFSGEPEGLWSALLRRKGGSFALLSLMPDDPSLN